MSRNYKLQIPNSNQYTNSKFQRAKRSLGQNFLVDANYQRKIVSAIEKDYDGETIVEIGPGRGALTQHLVGLAKNLVLIEKDDDLAEKAKNKFCEHKHVRVIHSDFMDLDITELNANSIIVGNLPYNVASQIFIRLLKNNHLFKKLFLMFQKEVAIRCVAGPGSKDYSVLSVWTQLFSQPKILFDVPPNAFLPKPKVTSGFVRFDIIARDYQSVSDFIKFVKRLFQQRRKKIKATVKQMVSALNESKFEGYLDCRPEQLTIAELEKVYAIALTES